MIDALYNYRQGEIHSAEFSDEFNKLCIDSICDHVNQMAVIYWRTCKPFRTSPYHHYGARHNDSILFWN